MSNKAQSAIARVRRCLESHLVDEAWATLQPHRNELPSDLDLAEAWAQVAAAGVPVDRWWDGVQELTRAYRGDAEALSRIRRQFYAAAQGRPMDEPDDERGVVAAAVAFARSALSACQGTDPAFQAAMHGSLGNALRLAGPGGDEESEQHLKAALALEPDPTERLFDWFDLGILYKWQGRWQEGLEANRKRLELSDDDNGAIWNLGICATGLGDGLTAHKAWTRFGVKERIGEDGLPVGGWESVQVRLSSLGPGVEPRAHTLGAVPRFENVWVERLSPCHGRIVNATVLDMPADFDDLVLWDGAPVDHRLSGEERVPRFPLLTVLRPGRARCRRFVANQPAARFWAELQGLPDGVVFYVHSEAVVWQCAKCAKGDQAHVHDQVPAHEVVSGKLIAPKDLPARELHACLEALCRKHGVAIAVPELYEQGTAEWKRATSLERKLSQRLSSSE